MEIVAAGNQSRSNLSLRGMLLSMLAVIIVGGAVTVGVLREPQPTLTRVEFDPGAEVRLRHYRDEKAVSAILGGEYRRTTVLVNELATAEQTLEAFLDADTAEALLPLVANHAAVEAEIRAYAAENELRSAAPIKSRFDSSGIIPDSGLTAYMFWVTVGDREVPVSVEETEAGFKIDWGAFIQFRDATLAKFLAEPVGGRGRFRVLLQRSHYFANDVSDIESLVTLRMSSPISPHPDAYVFTRKEDPTGVAIMEKYKWSSKHRPVVELEWVRPTDGGAPRIELVEIVRDHWREP